MYFDDSPLHPANLLAIEQAALDVRTKAGISGGTQGEMQQLATLAATAKTLRSLFTARSEQEAAMAPHPDVPQSSPVPEPVPGPTTGPDGGLAPAQVPAADPALGQTPNADPVQETVNPQAAPSPDQPF